MLLLPIVAALQIGAAAIDTVPVRPLPQLMHTTWTEKVGGSPIGIRTLAQTTDGYIWIGSFFGLWRFDGVRFVRYTPLGGDSIPDGAVLHLLASRDGSLWMIGGRGGVVSRLRDGRVTTYSEAEGLAPVTALTESSEGMMVAGTIDGLFRLSGGKWESADAAWNFPGERVRTAWFDRDDNLWVVTEDRMVYRPPGASGFVDPGIPINPANTEFTFAQESDGTVWLATVGTSLSTLHMAAAQPGRRTEIDIDPLAILIDRKGSLWVASGSDGLRRWPRVARIRGRRVTKSGPEAERFTMKDGLLTDIPTAVLEDHEGNIWVGSANGLERFREGAFTPVLTTGPARPRFVIAGRDSSVWTAPYNLGTLQRFGPHGQEDFYTGFFTKTVAQDASGRAIVVGDTRMLRLEGKRFVPVKLRPGTARGLYNVATDPAGNVWVHSEVHGLLRLDGDSLVPVANTVASMYHDGQPFSDSKGTIWVAQNNTVHRYAGHTLTTYSKDQGIWGFVYGFFEDTSGTIWAATGDGLSRFEGDSFHTLKRKGQIPGYTVVGMAQDDGGAWWLATMPGILRFPPGEIEHALADSNYVPNYRAFDESDGMVGALVKGYWGPVLAKSGDGKIWVATDSGIASIDPRRVPVAAPPPVSLEVARIEGRELAIVDGAELPPDTRDLEIDYTSLTFGTPERVRFRYQLEGADPAWRDVGDRRRAYYTGLAPGSYRFRVSASYGDGLWNESGAAWSFRVLPAWHATLWFKGLIILGFGGLVAFAVAMVQRGRHARAQQLLRHEYEATMAERARIADDLHDTLLQGFTGVNLQLTAAELNLPGNPEGTTATLVRIQRLAEESLREARERVWEMREMAAASDDLSTALEAVARDRTAGLPITVVVSASGTAGRLPRAVGDAAFRIGREAIMNVVRHAGASRIEIHLDFREKTFGLEVRDDGRGLSPMEAGEASRRGHFGLEGMKNRARHQGGRCEVRPRPGGGTIVAAEMPLVQVRI